MTLISTPIYAFSNCHSQEYRTSLLHELCQLPKETEWLELKCNNENPEEIGEYMRMIA